MMRGKFLLMFAAGSMLLTSCIKNEYHTVEPDPNPPVNNNPSGYRFVFDDNFDYDQHNWSFSDPANAAYVNISGGVLNYSYNPAGDGTNTVAVATGATVQKNFLVETRFTSDYAMGLAFGVSNTDYGYSFFIDDEGYFAVYKEGDANTQAKTILDWQFSSAIRQGGWNDVELEQINGYWIGYVNGTKLFEIPAQYLTGSKFGYIVLAGTTGKAEYLTVQW